MNGKNHYPDTITYENWPLYSYNPYAYQPVLYPYRFHSSHTFRILPPTNPQVLMQSARIMDTVLKDAEKITSKMASSQAFSTSLMKSAQESNLAAVTKMIYGIGLKNLPKISFNPDGIHLDFSASHLSEKCCRLVLLLKWA